MQPITPSWQTMYVEEKYGWFWPPAFDPQADPPELAPILKLIDMHPGTHILDLACGQGWLTIPLAQHGFQVTGYDLSTALLNRAQQAAKDVHVEVEWVEGDMRSLPAEWTGNFDCVLFTLSEFGCFDDPHDNQSVLNEAMRVLKGNGRFLLDIVVNRDGLVNREHNINYLQGNNFFVIEQSSLDLLTGIHKRKFQWYDQGQLHEAHWQIQTYTPPEVKRMLEQAGFQVIGAHANITGDVLKPDSIGMTFMAQKQEGL